MRRPILPVYAATPAWTDADRAELHALGAVLADDHDAAMQWTPPPARTFWHYVGEVAVSVAIVAALGLFIVALAV